MNTSFKMAIVTVVLGAVFFLTAPNGPLGGFWGTAPGPEPSGVQVPLFMLLGLIEALVSAFGVAFYLFGYPVVSAISVAPRGLTRATHISISWSLFSWWSHGSLHIVNGVDPGGLLAIDYGYHVTLIVAALIIASFFWTLLRTAVAAKD
ncbi:MAG: hypothetical protein L0177_18775 [Chloroflexi bacterium]|nr:hypothetical protein [Chloroflexota bacterium]